jgi:hypothetical protein
LFIDAGRRDDDALGLIVGLNGSRLRYTHALQQQCKARVIAYTIPNRFIPIETTDCTYIQASFQPGEQSRISKPLARLRGATQRAEELSESKKGLACLN